MLFRDLPQFNQFDRTGLMRQGKMRLSVAPNPVSAAFIIMRLA